MPRSARSCRIADNPRAALELFGSVERVSELLRDVSDEQWQSWIDAVHRELMAHDARGLDRLLSGYGGMGSFNDLVIHPVNGHSAGDADVDAINSELARLRSEMYEDGWALQRDLGSASDRP